MDEFITFSENVTAAFFETGNNSATELPLLSTVLDSDPLPFVRLPWWVVGSDGLEARPKRLLIRSYLHGHLEEHHLKTFAKSDEISDFSFPLHPFVRDGQKMLTSNKTRADFVESSTLRADEKTLMTIAGKTVFVPATKMFLKHYVYLSWEEYAEQRAKYPFIGGGDANIWANQPREKWLSGHGVDLKTPNIAAQFSDYMAVKVEHSFIQKLKNTVCGNFRRNSSLLSTCGNIWGLSNRLKLPSMNSSRATSCR
jgi:hypothetical protein